MANIITILATALIHIHFMYFKGSNLYEIQHLIQKKYDNSCIKVALVNKYYYFARVFELIVNHLLSVSRHCFLKVRINRAG